MPKFMKFEVWSNLNPGNGQLNYVMPLVKCLYFPHHATTMNV